MKPSCEIDFCKYAGEKEYDSRWFCFYHYLLCVDRLWNKNKILKVKHHKPPKEVVEDFPQPNN